MLSEVLHVHVHLSGDEADQLGRIESKLDQLLLQGEAMTIDLQGFDSQITHLTDVEEGVKTLVSKMLDDVATANQQNQAAVDAKVAEFKAHLDDLASFVSTNTAGAPAVPGDASTEPGTAGPADTSPGEILVAPADAGNEPISDSSSTGSGSTDSGSTDSGSTDSGTTELAPGTGTTDSGTTDTSTDLPTQTGDVDSSTVGTNVADTGDTGTTP